MRSALLIMTTMLLKCEVPVTQFLSLCSSQASPEKRHFTPLPRRPESRRLVATLPAPSSGTGWYQDSGTGAHPSLWCTVGLVVQLLSLRRSYQSHYQNCRLSQERVRRRWRLLMTGLAANVPGENTETCYLDLFLCFINLTQTDRCICLIYMALSRVKHNIQRNSYRDSLYG